MKKLIIIYLMSLLFVFNLYTTTNEFSIVYKKYPKDLIKMLKITPIPVTEYIIFYGKKYDVPIEIVYGIIKKESNFKYTKSLRPNRDGSIDFGLMGINSNNLKNKNFVRKFMDYDDIYDKDDHRLNIKIGIRYYRYLYNRLKNHKLALMAYNCGIGKVLKNNIPKKSIEYANYILSINLDNYSSLNDDSCVDSTNNASVNVIKNIVLHIFNNNDERRKIKDTLDNIIFEYIGSV